MKQCDTCIYGNKSECEKPCIVYKGENCELYEKRGEDMTRDEAIKELSEMRTDAWTDSRQMEALEMAVKALESIPKYKDAYNKGWDDGAKAAYEHLKMCEEEQEPCDLISRQAVIDLISKFILEIHTEGGRDLNAHTNDVLRQILRNVKSDRVLPSVNSQEPCDVAINRQAVIGLIADYDLSMGQVVKNIFALPPVTPQPKTGHWIEKDGFDGDTYYDCSECGESWTTIEGTPWDNEWNYCPYCGCRMIEPQERSGE